MAMVSMTVMSVNIKEMNLFLKALESFFLPEYDDGFWVANILKFLCGLMCFCCSGMNS